MRYYMTLEVIRGLFAIWVLVIHLNRMVTQTTVNTFGTWIDFGASGVDYFFVLSGFLMYFIHRKDIGFPKKAKFYYLKRVGRIYPMFWIALALSVSLLPFSSSLTIPPLIDVIKHVLLITPHIDDQGHGRVLGVAWTLELEVIFYLAFGLLLLIKSSLWRKILFLSGLAISIFAPYYLLFYAGILTGYLASRNEKPIVSSWLFPITLIAIFFIEDASFPQFLEKILFGINFSIMILALVSTERKYSDSIAKIPEILLLNGKYSYSIYLLHIPIALVLFTILKTIGVHEMIPGWLTVILLSSATWGVTMLAGAFIEMPMNNWVQKRIKSMHQKENNTSRLKHA